MDLGLAGKTALVCGGSRGMGLAIAEELGAEGCRLLLVARDASGLEAAVDHLKIRGIEAGGCAADLSDLDSYERILEAVETSFGAPDIAIYNGYVPRHGGFDDISESDFDAVNHAIVTCFARMIRVVTPGMKTKGWAELSPSIPILQSSLSEAGIIHLYWETRLGLRRLP